MPSPQFIKSYFSSFTDDIISQPLQKGEKKDEDKDKEGEAAEVTGRSVGAQYQLTLCTQVLLGATEELLALFRGIFAPVLT